LAEAWVAIDAGADRRAAARRLSRVHDRAVGGGTIEEAGDPAGVRGVIADSWRRSSRAGVDADGGLAPRRLTADEAHARWESSPLACAEPVLARMLDELEAGGQVALVCDADGTMLWIDGDQRIIEEGHAIHLEVGSGWSEQQAGTNAMGTALAVDHQIQVFSAEHFSTPVHGWTCSAAPISDPETGEQLGVVDLSGELRTAHPHSLTLVAMAARMIEAEIAAERAMFHRSLLGRHVDRLGGGASAASGLISPKGTVLGGVNEGLIDRRVDVPPHGGVVEIGEELFMAEPIDGGGFLVWPTTRRTSRRGNEPALAPRIEVLGTDRGTLRGVRGRELSKRHSELLVLLVLNPEGISAERVAQELYGDFGKPVSARAELSRLRTAVGLELEANPYRLSPPASADFLEVEALLRSGRVEEALSRYRGPLMPSSEVPSIVEAREVIDNSIREAVLASADPALLDAWLENPAGRDDIEATRALTELLDRADPRRSAALARLRRLSRT